MIVLACLAAAGDELNPKCALPRMKFGLSTRRPANCVPILSSIIGNVL